MELALKRDLLNEAERNGGKILLHDETEAADGSFNVYATWEEVSDAELVRSLCSLTISDVSNSTVFSRRARCLLSCERRDSTSITSDYQVRGESHQLDFRARSAFLLWTVTDEQSPIPATYSRIEARVVEALSRRDEIEYGIIFNCQMGSYLPPPPAAACSHSYYRSRSHDDWNVVLPSFANQASADFDLVGSPLRSSQTFCSVIRSYKRRRAIVRRARAWFGMGERRTRISTEST